jgi:thiol-disulfide isomerase/thioredoxin
MRVLTSFFMFAVLLFSSITHAEVMLQNLQGEDIALSSLKGKWVFINYWASWCGPCLDEISALNRFYKENKERDVEVYAVNYDSLPLNRQQRLIKKFDIRYPSLKHSVASILHLGNIEVVPVTFVFNPEGELSTTLYGGQTVASLTEAMAVPFLGNVVKVSPG